MSEFAELTFRGRTIRLPATVGTEGEIGLDVSALRDEMGVITLDPGYGNTGSCQSSIAFIDGDQGILRYRGYDIADLAEHSAFLEVAYLLLHGNLPEADQFDEFAEGVMDNMLVHENLRHFFNAFPRDAHPMAVAAAVVASLATFYPESMGARRGPDAMESCRRLLAKLPTIVAWSYKQSRGVPVTYPRCDLGYVQNFLHMMFSTPYRTYEPDPAVSRAMDLMFLLHADHEQNCSTSTVRMVGSSQANMFASISAGVSALWGPLHGGANQALIEMLQYIQLAGLTARQFVDKVKNKEAGIRLMGFGHRVYKNYDPRAMVLKKAAGDVLQKLGVQGRLMDTAMELEQVALSDPYFLERKLYPNVDFYSGIILHAIGMPTNMFTAIFAIGRMPGWLSQWMEMNSDPQTRIARPRQIYTGATQRTYVPFRQRGDGRIPNRRPCSAGE
jgi:citrate synthase